MVLSHALWKGHFAADPQILGKSIVLNRGSFTVVGVAPEGFSGASIIGADLWAPFSVHEQWNQGKNYLADANMSWLEVAGRLKPGVSLAAARADLAVIAAGVDRQNPGRKTTLLVDTATFMNNPEGRGPVLGVGAMILAAVSLVLVIACANLANLLLARAVGRRKEIAVRLAVGASRWRLLRQLLTESLLLSAAGGVLGLLAAWATLRTMVPLLMAQLPDEVQSIALNPNPDIRIVLYSLALAFVTGIGFGLIPALQGSNPDLNSALKDSGATTGGRSAGWLRNSLVTAQVAVCLVLLMAAGLLVRGLQSAQAIDPGFETRGIVTAGFDLSLEGYDEPRAAAFHRQLAERLAARPGISGVAFVDSVPLSGSRRGTMVTLEGKSRQLSDHQCRSFGELLPASRHSDRARPRVRSAREQLRTSTSSSSASPPPASSGPAKIPSASACACRTLTFYQEVSAYPRTSRHGSRGGGPGLRLLCGRTEDASRPLAAGQRERPATRLIAKAIREEVRGARFQRAGADRVARKQPGTLPASLANSFHPGVRARSGRAAARLPRDLRRDGLCRDPADEGNRYPHDDGRAAARRDAAHPRPVHAPRRGRRRGRAGTERRSLRVC